MEDFVKVGYLSKLAGILTQRWDSSYFVLSKNGTLFFFEDQQVFKDFGPPDGKISLQGCSVQRFTEQQYKQTNCFGINTQAKPHSKSYVLCASTVEQMESWISKIEEQAFRGLRSDDVTPKKAATTTRSMPPVFSPFRAATTNAEPTRAPTTPSSGRSIFTQKNVSEITPTRSQTISTPRNGSSLASTVSPSMPRSGSSYENQSEHNRHRSLEIAPAPAKRFEFSADPSLDTDVNEQDGLAYSASVRSARRNRNVRFKDQQAREKAAIAEQRQQQQQTPIANKQLTPGQAVAMPPASEQRPGPVKGLTWTTGMFRAATSALAEQPPQPQEASPQRSSPRQQQTPKTPTLYNSSLLNNTTPSRNTHRGQSPGSRRSSDTSTATYDGDLEAKYLQEEEKDFQRFQELSRLKMLGDQAFSRRGLGKESSESDDILLSIIKQSLEVDQDNLYLVNLRQQIEEKKKIMDKLTAVRAKVKENVKLGEYSIAVESYLTILPFVPSHDVYAECVQEIIAIEEQEKQFNVMQYNHTLALRRLMVGDLDEAQKLLDAALECTPEYCPLFISHEIDAAKAMIASLEKNIEEIKKEQARIDALFRQRKFEICITEYEALMRKIDPRIMHLFYEELGHSLNLSNTWMNMLHQAREEQRLAQVCHRKGQFKMCVLHLTEAADLYCRVQADDWESEFESIQIEIKAMKRERLASLYRKGTALISEHRVQEARECYMHCALREPQTQPYQRGLRRTEILMLLAVCDREEIEKKFSFENENSCLFCCAPPDDEYPQFTMLNRRHHCRVCMTSICDDHGVKAFLTPQHTEKAYACRNCAAAQNLSFEDS